MESSSWCCQWSCCLATVPRKHRRRVAIRSVGSAGRKPQGYRISPKDCLRTNHYGWLHPQPHIWKQKSEQTQNVNFWSHVCFFRLSTYTDWSQLNHPWLWTSSHRAKKGLQVTATTAHCPVDLFLFLLTLAETTRAQHNLCCADCAAPLCTRPIRPFSERWKLTTELNTNSCTVYWTVQFLSCRISW